MYIYGILFEIWIFWSQFFLTFFLSFDLHYYFFLHYSLLLLLMMMIILMWSKTNNCIVQLDQMNKCISNENYYLVITLTYQKTMFIILLMELAELAKQKNGCKRIKWLNGWLFSKKYFRPGIFIWLLFSSFRFVCSLLVCVCVIRVTLNFLFRFVENRIFTFTFFLFDNNQ